MATSFDLPPELCGAVAAGRVIPFIGAGLSAALGLPLWDELLERIAPKLTQDIAYPKLAEMCGGDPLRIAEFLFLNAGKDIGPLRHRISQLLSVDTDPLLSTAHVELVNLGARKIYTTNYDDSIERTFDGLGVDYALIALPRHVARGGGTSVEIVKYHGDLQYERTLVLTESAYYERLDFESPLDIKLRSDVLGNSVLFLGYGFTDINIRILWHRLMRVMRDVPESERPASYIVRLHANAAMTTLDSAVGIRTIELDPARACETAAERAWAIGSFLQSLAWASGAGAYIPLMNSPRFLSRGALADVRAALASTGDDLGALDRLMSTASLCRIPSSLRDEARQLLVDTGRSTLAEWQQRLALGLMTNFVGEFGEDSLPLQGLLVRTDEAKPNKSSGT